MFVPGMDGRATLKFTLIARDVAREEFLGQALLRLKDTSLWQTGGSFSVKAAVDHFSRMALGGNFRSSASWTNR